MLSATPNAFRKSTYHSSYVAFDLPQPVNAKHQPHLNVYGDQVFVTKSEYEDRLAKVKSTLVSALRSRGVRGIFSFLNTLKKASDVTNSLSLIKFEQVILSQRLPLSRPDIIILFNSYDTRNRNIISLEKFTESLLRTRLSEHKFNVLNIFLDKLLQSGSTDDVKRPSSAGSHELSVNSGVSLLNSHHLRMMFNPSGHPDVVAGRSNETEILLEFLDSFDYNYDITKYEFFKYYEIIATVIPDDDEFVRTVNGVWNLHLDLPVAADSSQQKGELTVQGTQKQSESVQERQIVNAGDEEPEYRRDSRCTIDVNPNSIGNRVDLADSSHQSDKMEEIIATDCRLDTGISSDNAEVTQSATASNAFSVETSFRPKASTYSIKTITPNKHQEVELHQHQDASANLSIANPNSIGIHYIPLQYLNSHHITSLPQLNHRRHQHSLAQHIQLSPTQSLDYIKSQFKKFNFKASLNDLYKSFYDQSLALQQSRLSRTKLVDTVTYSGEGVIDFQAFVKGLVTALPVVKECLGEDNLSTLWKWFDREGNGIVEFKNVVTAFRDKELSPRRIKVLEQAFQKLDPENKGEVKVDRIEKMYQAKYNINVMTGLETEQVVLNNLINEFIVTDRATVTKSEFFNFYANRGCQIEDDGYFVLMVWNEWGLSSQDS